MCNLANVGPTVANAGPLKKPEAQCNHYCYTDLTPALPLLGNLDLKTGLSSWAPETLLKRLFVDHLHICSADTEGNRTAFHQALQFGTLLLPGQQNSLFCCLLQSHGWTVAAVKTESWSEPNLHPRYGFKLSRDTVAATTSFAYELFIFVNGVWFL